MFGTTPSVKSEEAEKAGERQGAGHIGVEVDEKPKGSLPSNNEPSPSGNVDVKSEKVRLGSVAGGGAGTPGGGLNGGTTRHASPAVVTGSTHVVHRTPDT